MSEDRIGGLGGGVCIFVNNRTLEFLYLDQIKTKMATPNIAYLFRSNIAVYITVYLGLLE